MLDQKSLEIAYKYPFSQEAKEVIKSLDSSRLESKYLELGKKRVEEALSKGYVEFGEANSEELKLSYLISYVYARMIVSAIGPVASSIFATAEAKRVARALSLEKDDFLIYIASELGIKASLDKGSGFFLIPFYSYLEVMPKSDEYRLIHQKLSNGIVYLERYKFIRILENASRRAIIAGLPIPKKDLPKEALDVAKEIKMPEAKQEAKIGKEESGRYAWIEKLLAHPLPDFRHRVVNLVLAPYFANIKKLSEEDAVKVILQYIERCKEVNPDTRVGEAYITYQVKYAKRKGLKPLSLEKAKELLGSVINFDELMK